MPRKVFVNELGNTVIISAVKDSDGILVMGRGPTSCIDHKWTRIEAEVLRDLLSEVLDAPIPSRAHESTR
jgi:hypothetical protein